MIWSSDIHMTAAMELQQTKLCSNTWPIRMLNPSTLLKFPLYNDFSPKIKQNPNFPNGTVNGASGKPVLNGMSDVRYL